MLCLSPGPGPESCHLDRKEGESGGLEEGLSLQQPMKDKEQAARSSGGRPEAWTGGPRLCEGQKLQLCDKVHAPRASCLLENMSEKPWPC